MVTGATRVRTVRGARDEARRSVARRVLCGALALLPAVGGAAVTQEARIGGVDVIVWTPASAPGVPLPVIVFSHALYTCAGQSSYLTGALADAGYLVIAPQHADSTCRVSLPSMWRMSLKPSYFWSDRDYRDRADDIRAVLAALPGDPHFGAVADPARLALVGHSLGGYTVLGLAGAWPSWRLPGVRAIVALSPYSLPFEASEGMRHIGVPVMFQVGTLDPLFTVPLRMFGYEQTPAPKYLVQFALATHLAWTDAGVTDRDDIVGYAVAFLDHYVKDVAALPVGHADSQGVASFTMN